MQSWRETSEPYIAKAQEFVRHNWKRILAIREKIRFSEEAFHLVLAGAVGGRPVPFRRAVLRAIMWATWKARVQPSDPGWLDIATSVPVMSTERARAELGWVPTVSAESALAELLEGLAGAHTVPASPPLH